jgi:hypothetical protein
MSLLLPAIPKPQIHIPPPIFDYALWVIPSDIFLIAQEGTQVINDYSAVRNQEVSNDVTNS